MGLRVVGEHHCACSPGCGFHIAPLVEAGAVGGFAAESGFSTSCPCFCKASDLQKLQPHGESDSLHSQSPTAPYECSSLRTGRAGEATPDS